MSSHASKILAAINAAMETKNLEGKKFQEIKQEKINALAKMTASAAESGVEVLGTFVTEDSPFAGSLLTPHQLFKTALEAVQSLDRSNQLYWQGALLSHYTQARDDFFHVGVEFDKKYSGMRRTVDEEDTVCFIDSQGGRHDPDLRIVNWQRAVDFCQNCVTQLASELKDNVFSEKDVHKKLRSACDAYRGAGDTMAELNSYIRSEIFSEKNIKQRYKNGGHGLSGIGISIRGKDFDFT